jgi:integrase
LFPVKAFVRDGVRHEGGYVRLVSFYRASWDRACAELGIKGLTFHATRHTFASKCLHHGASPQEVANWLGDTLEVFYQHYAHLIAVH